VNHWPTFREVFAAVRERRTNSLREWESRIASESPRNGAEMVHDIHDLVAAGLLLIEGPSCRLATFNYCGHECCEGERYRRATEPHPLTAGLCSLHGTRART
jgi:hypothetical protein